MFWMITPTTPLFSNMGTDGARKTNKVSIKKREVSRNFFSLFEVICSAVLEKTIYKWGQMSNYHNLSPLVFAV
jgi:hypothetical protein